MKQWSNLFFQKQNECRKTYKIDLLQEEIYTF